VSTRRIVGRREFVERARDRGFAVSTVITLAILVGFIVVASFLNRGVSFDLAVVGEGSRAIGREAANAGAALEIEVRLHTLPDDATARQAVRDGEADAALIAGTILVRAEPPAQLVGLIQAVSLRQRSREVLEGAGLSAEQVAAALAQRRSRSNRSSRGRATQRIGDRGLRRRLAAVRAAVRVRLLGAAGVVEEKSSRVIEVLISTVRPSELLRGKIFGIGILGLSQLLLIGVVGLATSIAVGSLEFPSGALATVGLVLFWFMLGFFFYAGLFAVAGSIVTRQEDLQTTMTPLTILIVGSFFIGLGATGDPDSKLATVASLLPFSSPLVMPTRIVLGEASAPEIVLSIAISVASTAALIPVATKIYSRALLQPGRVKLRQVLRRT
jgi:ABC-2 type transport system permease protein